MLSIVLFCSLFLVPFSHSSDLSHSNLGSRSDSALWYGQVIQAAAASNSRAVFEYDCIGKIDGNYPHPSKCTHYVACVAQTYAYEMPCDLMPDGTPKYFVATSGPSPQTSYCDDPTTTDCAYETPTTTTTTAAASTTTTTENPGENDNECVPEECQLVGDCQKYRQCVESPEDPRKGHWVHFNCSVDLFWNPAVNSVHGGVCDYFYNLPESVQRRYTEDAQCIAECGFWQKEEDWCSPRYSYRAQFQGSHQGREENLECPRPPSTDLERLCWSQDILSCDRCSNVRYPNGTACSP